MHQSGKKNLQKSISLNFCLFLYRIWDVNTGELLNTLIHHVEAVLHLRFQDGMLVTWLGKIPKII